MLFSAESLSIFNSLYCELQHTGKDSLLKKGIYGVQGQFSIDALVFKGRGRERNQDEGGMWVLVIQGW